MDLDRRRLADAQHLVGVEVGLLAPAIFQRYLAIERGGEAENGRALDLRPDKIGIDHNAAVNGADDPPDTNSAILRHFNLGDQRQIGPEDELDRDATADPFWQRLKSEERRCSP
jgi:hypothetical protein